jgi:hypothetical protein
MLSPSLFRAVSYIFRVSRIAYLYDTTAALAVFYLYFSQCIFFLRMYYCVEEEEEEDGGQKGREVRDGSEAEVFLTDFLFVCVRILRCVGTRLLETLDRGNLVCLYVFVRGPRVWELVGSNAIKI